jgi:hypothetical protein
VLVRLQQVEEDHARRHVRRAHHHFYRHAGHIPVLDHLARGQVASENWFLFEKKINKKLNKKN